MDCRGLRGSLPESALYVSGYALSRIRMPSQNTTGRTKSKEYFRPAATPAHSVLVEAAAGFAAEPAGGDVFFEQRAGAVFGIAEAVVQNFENVHANVEADEIGEFERAHGMVHAQFHHCVHRFGSGDALQYGVSGFVNHRHKNAIGDEAGSVVHRDRLFAELFAQRHDGRESVLAGLQAANDFDERHHGNRIHEMHADEIFGARSFRGERSDGNRRGVAGEDHARAKNGVRFLEHALFQLALLGHSFDGHVRGGEVVEIGGGENAFDNFGLVGFGDFRFFDFAVEIFADGVERAREIFLVYVAQHDFVAGFG